MGPPEEGYRGVAGFLRLLESRTVAMIPIVATRPPTIMASKRLLSSCLEVFLTLSAVGAAETGGADEALPERLVRSVVVSAVADGVLCGLAPELIVGAPSAEAASSMVPVTLAAPVSVVLPFQV